MSVSSLLLKIPSLFNTLLFILGVVQFANAQGGRPFIRHYNADEYKASAQNWDVTCRPDGVMFFGNNDGVLSYDGARWREINVTNGAYSLACSPQGEVFVGSAGDAGVLVPEKTGKLKFKSLISHLPDSLRKFDVVWETCANAERTVFNTNDFLIVYEKNNIRIIPGPISSLKQVGKRQIFQAPGKGIFELTADGKKLLTADSIFIKNTLSFAGETKDENWLFGTYRFGIFELNQVDSLVPYPTNCDAYLQQHAFYMGLQMHTGQIACATYSNGLVLLDEKQNAVWKLHSKNGLPVQEINGLGEDKRGGLWLATENGITHLEVSSPWLHYSAEEGLMGSVKTALRFRESFYVGTSQGVFVQNSNGSFEGFENMPPSCWDIDFFPQESDTTILLAASDGVYEVSENKTLRHIYSGEDGIQLFIDPTRDWQLLATRNGLVAFRKKEKKWEFTSMLPGIKHQVWNVLPTQTKNKHSLWASALYDGVYRLNYTPQDSLPFTVSAHYDTLKGFKSVSDIRIYKFEDNLLFSSTAGNYQYEARSDSFVPFSHEKEINNLPKAVLYPITQRDGYSWYYGLIGVELKRIEALHKTPSGFQRDTTDFMRLPKQDVDMLFSEENKLWVGGTEGLFAYEASDNKRYLAPFHAQIREFWISEDSLAHWGESWGASTPYFKLPYGHNTLRIGYSATSFEGEVPLLYSYRLSNFHNEWSSWTSDTKKEFTNLSEGDYTFEVRAKNLYGQYSEVAQFQFKITPPWYRTVLAYVLYAFFAILFFIVAIRLYTRRLRKAKERLEAIVEKRTIEIRKANTQLEAQKKQVEEKAMALQDANNEIIEKNAELEQQKEEILTQSEVLKEANHEIRRINEDLSTQREKLEHQHKNIMASISYAERIRQAILPPESLFATNFEDHFLFFRPRDVVSGDFYYFAKTKENIYVAAADCTGHGVPGGFMSMISYELMDEIIRYMSLKKPEEILETAHKGLVRALRQEESKQNDGMDLILLRKELASSQYSFAGANNPLYFIPSEGKSIEALNTNRRPIGGQTRNNVKPFTQAELPKDVRGAMVFLCSDGYQDQFGGANNKKFMKKRMRELFLSVSQKNGQEQLEIIEKSYTEWLGEGRQIDDVLVLGLRL